MTAYVTADWARVVREDDPEAAFGVDESDLDRLGLRAQHETLMAPPEAKEMAKPADKALRKPASK